MFGLYHGGFGYVLNKLPVKVKDGDEAMADAEELIKSTLISFKEGNWVNALYPAFYLRPYDEKIVFDDIYNDDIEGDKVQVMLTISFLVENIDITLFCLYLEDENISRVSVRLPKSIVQNLKGYKDKTKIVEQAVIEYILNNLAIPSSLAKTSNNYGVLTSKGILMFKNGLFKFEKNKYIPVPIFDTETALVDFKFGDLTVRMIKQYAQKNNLKITDIIKNALSTP